MLRIRVTLGLRPLLAGGTGYASERPRDEEVRVFLSHGLSGAQGVTTVPHQLLHRHHAADDATRYVDVTLVFAPREAAQLARSEQRFWAPHAADDAGVPHTTDVSDGRTVIPPSARLVVNGYVRTYSDAGMVARQPVGSASFLLAQLAGELPHTHADARGAAAAAAATLNAAEPGVRRALRDDSGDVPLVKGFVTAVAFSVLDERGRASALGAHVRFDARPNTLQRSVFQPGDPPPYAALARRAHAALHNAIEQSMAMFFVLDGSDANAPPPLLGTSDPAHLRSMHTPEYRTSAGSVCGSEFGARMPRLMHADSYFSAALALTLRRANLSAERLLRAMRAQDNRSAVLCAGMDRASAVLVDTLAVLARSFAYVDDFEHVGGKTLALVRRRGGGEDTAVSSASVAIKSVDARTGVLVVEKFLTTDGAGDCEDLAYVVHADALQFARHMAHLSQALHDNTLHRDAADAALRELLHELGDALFRSRAYLPSLMVLGSVSAKNPLAEPASLSDADAGAHTYTVFVPTARYQAALPPEGESADADAHRHCAYARAYRPLPWHAQLHVRVAEATAYSSSDLLPLPEAAARRQDARAALQRALMQHIPAGRVSSEVLNRARAGDAPKSNFYKGVSTAFARHAADSGGSKDVAFAMRVAPGRYTHGATFGALISRPWPAALTLLPYNTLAPAVQAYSCDVLEQLEPVPALRRDERAARAPVPLPAALQRYADRAPRAAYVRPPTPEQDGGDDALRTGVPLLVALFVRHLDMDDALAAAIARGIEATRHMCAGEPRIYSHYLCDELLPGDDMGAHVIHDIVFTLAEPR